MRKLIVTLCCLCLLPQCSLFKQQHVETKRLDPALLEPVVLSDNLLQFTVVKAGARIFASERFSLQQRSALAPHDWKIQLMTPLNAADDSRLECLFEPASLGQLVLEQPSIPLDPNNPARSKAKSASLVISAEQAKDFGVTLQVVSSYNFAKVKQRVSLVAVPVNYKAAQQR